MTWIITLIVIALAIWIGARLLLAGSDLSEFDMPRPEPINDAPSAGNQQVLETVREFARTAASSKGRAQLLQMREAMESMGDNADLSGVEIRAATVSGRPAEWVLATSRRGSGRLLYLHGGAFTMGSPKSHRGITAELARRTGLDVLAVDYRLMPEHPRRAGIDDCRAAYRWILENGPAGPEPADTVFIAGDSAGGNLTLALIAWLRDQRNSSARLRQADGAIALSPLTDSTFASPSMRHNVDRDPMLGPMAKLINKVPRTLMLWGSWLQNRIRPNDPLVSPLRGDLSNLPPVLVQASEAEILIDDARRYANKARASGTPAEIETWHGMVHAWQAFGIGLPESEQAFTRMAEFVRRVLDSRGRADAA
ncbi:MAG: alpha/beta hydrolase [Pseudomonadales bacterium]